MLRYVLSRSSRTSSHFVVLTSPLTQSPQELRVTELPDPIPASDEYLIEVHAAATNFFDILQIQGKYQNQPRAASLLSPAYIAFSMLTLRLSIPLGIRCRVRRRGSRHPFRPQAPQVPR